MANSLDFIQGSIKNWWLTALIGILMIGTSVYLFSEPEGGFEALSVVFAVVFLLTGVFMIAFSITNSDTMQGWGWYLVLGILALVSGVFLLSEPQMAQISLAIFVAMFFLFQSVGAIGASFDLRDAAVKGWGWLLVLGILGIVLSFFLFRRLDISAMTIVALTGINFLLLGIMFLVLAFQLRKIKRTPERVSNSVKKGLQDAANQVQEAAENVKKQFDS